MNKYNESDYNRFWSKVSKSDNCWLWKASCFKDGYGQFSLKNINLKSHRVAWELTNGEIPSGLQVLHTCDNPACVNPAHLFLGTNQDNVDDKVNKKRQHRPPLGEKHPNAKVTDKQRAEIKQRYETGDVFQKDLALEYGITQQGIHDIIYSHGGTSKWRNRRLSGDNHPNRKISDTEREQIKTLFDQGNISKSAIARKYGVSATLIRKILQSS